MSCGVGRRHGSDPARLWLWRRPAAVALIRPPSLGTSICQGVALKRQKKKKSQVGDKESQEWGVAWEMGSPQAARGQLPQGPVWKYFLILGLSLHVGSLPRRLVG